MTKKAHKVVRNTVISTAFRSCHSNPSQEEARARAVSISIPWHNVLNHAFNPFYRLRNQLRDVLREELLDK